MENEKIKNITWTVPAAISSLPNLDLLERATLAHIAEFPACTNGELAKLTGRSVRGIEVLIARLCSTGLVKRVGEGCARRLKLVLPAECHTPCGKADADKPHTKCVSVETGLATTKRLPSLEVLIGQELEYYANCIDFGLFDHAGHHLESIRKALEQDDVMPPEKRAEYVAGLKVQEDRCYAFEVGAKLAKDLPTGQQERLALALCNASGEKLAIFRQRVEAGALGNSALEVLTLTNG